MQFTTLRHGLNRVANQIVKCSDQLVCIGPNRRHIIGNYTTALDVPGLQLRIGCVQRLLQEGLEISALKYILGNPGQIQKILHQGIDPVQFPRNGSLKFFKKPGLFYFSRQQLDKCLNGRQRIPDFVGHSGGQCPQGR